MLLHGEAAVDRVERDMRNNVTKYASESPQRIRLIEASTQGRRDRRGPMDCGHPVLPWRLASCCALTRVKWSTKGCRTAAGSTVACPMPKSTIDRS
jgi:hypothetical protein